MVVNENAAVYYRSGYWNDLLSVQAHLNERATGSANVGWVRHATELRGAPFRKGLFLNCGNGWVEREWLDAGAVGEAVGVDYSQDLLAQAKESAEGRAVRYYQLDANTARFPEDGFDLIVNHAAMHHLAYLDRVMRELARLLSPDGWLVNWDYVGAHRNQYSWAQWADAQRCNAAAPAHLRQVLRYPDLASMMHDDPTEAIHSELFEEVVARYFSTVHSRSLGGWLAYLLFTFNTHLFEAGEDASKEWIDDVLRADAAHADAERTLFRYLIARPHEVAPTAVSLDRWSLEEEQREAMARDSGGVYYPMSVRSDLAELRSGGVDRTLVGPLLYRLVVRRLRAHRRSKAIIDSVARRR